VRALVEQSMRSDVRAEVNRAKALYTGGVTPNGDPVSSWSNRRSSCHLGIARPLVR